MQTLDLDAIANEPAKQDRATGVRRIVDDLVADHHRHIASAAAPLIATMNRIEAMNAAA